MGLFWQWIRNSEMLGPHLQ